MTYVIRAVVVSLSLLTLTTSAAAECAWVLWKNDPELGSTWQYTGLGAAGGPIIPEVFKSRTDCEATDRQRSKNRASAENIASDRAKPLRAATFICLPDTVDPRG